MKISDVKIGTRFRKDLGELSSLVESIEKQGLLQPIGVTKDNELVFGMRRIEAYKLLERDEIEARIVNVTSILEGEFAENEIRKRFTLDERVAIGKAVEDMLPERRGLDSRSEKFKSTNIGTFKKKTQDIAAKRAGFGSHGTYEKAKTVSEKATPEAKESIDKGESTINAEYNRVLSKEKIRENTAIKEGAAVQIDDKFDVIVIDPPWPMKKIVREVSPNQVESLDYPTMSIEEIQNIEIPSSADCHLFLWTTQKFLPESFKILDEWGFKYICVFVWHKPGGFQPVGLPQYNCEFVVYSRKGTPVFRDTKNFNLCFEGKRGKHSEKPGGFYETIRRVTAGRRLDMFSRREIDGFESWGFEAE